MRTLATTFIAIVLLVQTGGRPAAGQGMPASGDTPYELARSVIHGNGSEGPYHAGGRFIGGTVEVEDASFTPPPAIRSWDTADSTVTFTAPIEPGDSVVVSYGRPPDWLQGAYTRTVRAPVSTGQRRSAVRRGSATAPRPFPGLSFGGSKTFDVNVGSDRNVALNQSLRLSISGNLTDDITLDAAISDQDTPIGPEGDTRELNELDRVLIRVRGKRFSADMGDTDLARSAGRWQRYSRRLSGASLSIDTGAVDVFGSGAVSEGRYRSITLAPVEGNQGPYRLSADNGGTLISVIPGTERVWINGEAMVRGLNNDYVIDYSTGELTFTERRIIGADMRIVVDYEYASESYRRTFYSGGADGSFFDGRLTVRSTIATERDDPDRPVYIELDDESRSILAAAGDSLAAVTGIRPAESDTTGTYDMVDGHLVYDPAGNGAYHATFSFVGRDAGSYRYLGGRIYEFVPVDERSPGSGASYEPVRTVQGPTAHTLAGVRIAFDPVSALHIESEVAGSSLDLNTLSSLDDGDNEGSAYTFSIKAQPVVNAGVPLKLSAGADRRDRDSRFAPLDRDRTAEENRRWGLPLVMPPGREVVSEYTAGVAVDGGTFSGTGLSLHGGQGSFGDDISSGRFGGEARIDSDGGASASVAMDRITRENVPGLPDEDIDRFDADASAVLAGFTPAVRYEGERAVGRTGSPFGSAYDDIRVTLGGPRWRGVTGEAEWLYRDERSRNRAWSDSATVRGAALELSSPGASGGSFRTRYAHRERTDRSATSSTDQALVEGSWRPAESSLTLDVSYRAGRSREASRRRNYIYAGTGRGSYRWEDLDGDGVRDDDEFIPDEHGPYYLYEETLDDYRPVNTVRTLARAGTDIPLGRLPYIGRATDITVRSETSFEVNEKSTAPASDIFLLRLGSFREEGRTTSGDQRIQQDVTAPLAGNGSVRLRLYRLDSFNAEFVSGAERRSNGEQSLRLRLPAGTRTDIETTIARGSSLRRMAGSSGDFDVASYSADAEVSHHPDPRLTLAAALGAGRDRDDITGIAAVNFSLEPSVLYRFTGRGRLEASYTVTSVTLEGAFPGARLPYTMARGRKEGRNHDVSVQYDYRLSDSMNIVLTYTGRKFADRKFENYAQSQVRAMF